MKSLLPIFLVATFISCHSKKTVIPTVTSQEDKYMKAEFYFDNCDELKNFLKNIIITNKEDTTVEKNYFRIPHIKSPFEFTKNIFHEECFVGISVEELDDIFGERAFLVTQGGKVVTTSTGSYPDFYYLESNNINLVFNVWINNNVVQNFKVVAGAYDSVKPIKKE